MSPATGPLAVDDVERHAVPVALVYATWSAAGIVCLAASGVVGFDETLDLAAIAGFLLVIAGIVLLNVYSSAYGPARRLAV